MTTITRLTPAEAQAKLDEGYIYLDVRSEPEFEEGHPAGAYNIPLLHSGPVGMTPNTDFVPVVRANFAKDAKLVLGCRSGGRSMRAAEMLIAEGYTNLLEQRAGWDGARNPFGQLTEAGWSKASLPVASGAPAGRCYTDMKAKLG